MKENNLKTTLALVLLLVPLPIIASCSSDDDNSCDRSTLIKPGSIGTAHGVMRIEGELTITYNRGLEWCTYLKFKDKYVYRHPYPEIQRQAFIASRFAALERLFRGKKV